MTYSQDPHNFFNVQLKLGAHVGSHAAKLAFAPQNGIKIPANLLKSKFKDTVCADTQLESKDVCPDVRFHRYPLYDGTCNNRIDVNRGKSFRPLKRLVPANYGDTFQTIRSSIRGDDLPSPRLVSNHIQNKESKVSNVTHMFTQWGQFIIHDIVHTPVIVAEDGSDLDCNCESPNAECANIEIPMDDYQSGFETTNVSRCQHFCYFMIIFYDIIILFISRSPLVGPLLTFFLPFGTRNFALACRVSEPRHLTRLMLIA